MKWPDTPYTVQLLPNLPPLHLVNRHTQEHVGACPFCGGTQRSDRFHVWLDPGHERYWCRRCNEKGPLKKLLGDKIQPQTIRSIQKATKDCGSKANPAHQKYYREIYTIVALWAHGLMLDPANPDPLSYMHKRGIKDETIKSHVLGVTLHNPQAIPELLQFECPELVPYAEEAGVLTRTYSGELRTHPNLCGALVFPYLANNTICDLRTRTYPGKGYRSLAGGYAERGAVFSFGWDDLDGSDTIILTEGEFKALAVTQAYMEGRISAPAMAHPGLSYIREEWITQLYERGVRTVILAYDSSPRPIKDGVLHLTAEELWAIRHGKKFAAAGMHVRVLRLPLSPGQEKTDLDAFLLEHGTGRLQYQIDTAPDLSAYHNTLPRNLLVQSKLPLPQTYPIRRGRPQWIKPSANRRPQTQPPSINLLEARDQIANQVAAHAQSEQGFLVLAHPPGTGKGHNTMRGLHTYLTDTKSRKKIVWASLRKNQIHDQEGLELIALNGRDHENCKRHNEAYILGEKGYIVSSSLCQHRCTAIDNCDYLCQFKQHSHFFASLPLLQSTGWWKNAGVLVLDEFDPCRLTRIVHLSSVELAAMERSNLCPHAHSVLRWLNQALGNTTDRIITGGTLLAELEANARAEQLDLAQTLNAACKGLPSEEQEARLPGFPRNADINAFRALPPNYLGTIIRRLAYEMRKYLAGIPFTSRIEISDGQISLFLSIGHMIKQLANPKQPKIVLDATVNANLLHAIFPNTPLKIEQPHIANHAHVIQVISRDWAKSTLRGTRNEQWHADVAAQIRSNRPTLIVCTQECEEGLRTALDKAGYTHIKVAHYGQLRGSNDYKGYDVILAQIYHPNLKAIVQTGRALFADDATPLNEEIIVDKRKLETTSGECWTVDVPTFVDQRLTALLENRREAEMVQCAMRGRPFDHPETQITLMFGMPLPGLQPTEIRYGIASPESNQGRHNQTMEKLIKAIQKLLDSGKRIISIDDIVRATDVSSGVVRKYWEYLAVHFHLRHGHQTRRHGQASIGQQRMYRRKVLIRRGRTVPPKPDSTPEGGAETPLEQPSAEPAKPILHARNRSYITRVKYRFFAFYRSVYHYRRYACIQTISPPGQECMHKTE